MAGISLLSRLATDTALLRQRMDILSRQVSSGRRGALYGDIAPDARRAIDLRADIALRATYQGAITRTLGRTQVAQTVIGQIESIANQAMANTLSLPGTDVRRVAIVAH